MLIRFISHNSRGYNAQFLLRRFLESKWRHKLIIDGTKILSMSLEHLHFLGSSNFIPMPLKDITEAFDLSCRKCYYPHVFNTVENINYVCPSPSYYGVDYMSSAESDRVLIWYNDQKDKEFNNDEKLLSACIDDVNVLRMACCSCRNLFLRLVDMEPFCDAITIASCVIKSLGECFWKRILYGGVGREAYLPGSPGIRVDGYCKETNEVFEYFGDFWYGCPCMSNRHK